MLCRKAKNVRISTAVLCSHTWQVIKQWLIQVLCRLLQRVQLIAVTDGVFRFIDIDSNQVVGTHTGSELFTVGQKAKIGGAAQKYFIAKKFSESEDVSTDSSFSDDDNKIGIAMRPRKGDVFVAAGSHHPSLQSNVLESSMDAFSWVAGREPHGLHPGTYIKFIKMLELSHH